MRTLALLRDDECGFVVSVELILMASIVVLGLMAGMTSVRDAVVSELSDVAGAVQDVNQSYTYFGVQGHSASTAGSDYVDELDFCDSAEDAVAAIDNCITIATATTIDEADALAAPTGI